MDFRERPVFFQRRRDHPLTQWILRMRSAKYRGNQQELAVLEKCRNRFAKYRVIGAVGTAGLVWTVAHELKWTLSKRLLIPAASAFIGSFMASSYGLTPCTEDILALDGSRFQKELVAILQRENTYAPRLRQIMEKYYYLEPVYDDSNQSVPLVRLRRRLTSGEGLCPNQPGFGTWDMKEDPSLQPETHDQKMDDDSLLQKSSQDADSLVDPFNMLLLMNSEDESISQIGEDKTLNRRKSRMTADERKEYSRMRYLEWKQKLQEVEDNKSSLHS